MPEKLSDIEIDKAAWKVLLDLAISTAHDWIDEEGEYVAADEVRIHERMHEILKELKERHL